MGSNIAARAATSGELAKFRGPGQYTKLGLAIHQPATVYTAQINQTFTTLDGVAELTYDGGTGTLADVLPGMTVYVGSSAGARDKGILRVRKDPTADTLYINQVSDIQFADNDYLTIVDAFALWPRDIFVSGGTTFMDYDIEFGDYRYGGPVPRVGPIAAVVKLVGGSASFSPPDPTGSACYDDATVASYLYEAPGAATTSDMDTSTPSWTYDTAGCYRWSCTITDSLGRESVSYRWVFVDPSPVEFNLDSCYGDYQSGYWTAQITMMDDADLSEIVERALVTVYADEELYNGVAGSIGKIAGYENILLTGWIEGESITRDPDAGTVTFAIRGPGFWLGKMRAFPFELQDSSSAPTSWKELSEMTVDKALAHLLMWTSTATTVMDCYFTGSTTRLRVITQPAGSLLDQLNAIALNTVFAKPQCNNYGQLYIEIDQQIMDTVERAALPVVMDITSVDYVGDLDLQRNTSSKTSMVELQGYEAYDGSTANSINSHAPGSIPKYFGGISSYNNYIFADEDECNRISGALLAFENNEYEPLDIQLSANNRLLDIAPRMACTISLASTETPRGITLSTARLIPRRVEFAWDKNNNVLLTNVTCEFETSGVDGVTYVPTVVGDGIPDLDIDIGDFGGFGNVDFPDLDLGDWFPEDIPPPVETPCDVYHRNFFGTNWDKSELRGDDSSKLSAKCYFPCKLRGSYVDSSLEINGSWFGDANTNYHVYALKNGARVLTASVTTQDGTGRKNYATFNTGGGDLEVDGFEITLDAGIGSPIVLLAGSVVASGSVSASNEAGVSISTSPNQYYSIEGAGGPWTPDITDPSWQSYAFSYYLTSWTPGGPGSGIGYDTVYGYLSDYGGVGGEQVGNYGRAYFKAPGTSMKFRVASATWDDNAGSLGYIVRIATVIGRRILLGGVTIKDVCVI